MAPVGPTAATPGARQRPCTPTAFLQKRFTPILPPFARFTIPTLQWACCWRADQSSSDSAAAVGPLDHSAGAGGQTQGVPGGVNPKFLAFHCWTLSCGACLQCTANLASTQDRIWAQQQLRLAVNVLGCTACIACNWPQADMLPGVTHNEQHSGASCMLCKSHCMTYAQPYRLLPVWMSAAPLQR